MMIKAVLVAVTMSTLLAGAAFADDKPRQQGYDGFRGVHYSARYDDRRYDDRYYDRRWRHVPPVHYRSNHGYRAGYEAGWRDAARQCRYDYRPGRWLRDSRDGFWYFGLQYDD